MDEPLVASREMGYSDAYGAQQTANWIALVRQKYPGVKIVDIEPYPAISASDLVFWMTNLRTACLALGVAPPETFELDHNWVVPYGEWTWGTLRTCATMLTISECGSA